MTAQEIPYEIVFVSESRVEFLVQYRRSDLFVVAFRCQMSMLCHDLLDVRCITKSGTIADRPWKEWRHLSRQRISVCLVACIRGRCKSQVDKKEAEDIGAL